MYIAKYYKTADVCYNFDLSYKSRRPEGVEVVAQSWQTYNKVAEQLLTIHDARNWPLILVGYL